jgi:hypothetical protein
LGCLPGGSRRANAVWRRVCGSLLNERRCFRRLEISRRHQARTAAASVALTRPEEHMPPRRGHAHALFPVGDGPVLGHPRRAVARRPNLRLGNSPLGEIVVPWPFQTLPQLNEINDYQTLYRLFGSQDEHQPGRAFLGELKRNCASAREITAADGERNQRGPDR